MVLVVDVPVVVVLVVDVPVVVVLVVDVPVVVVLVVDVPVVVVLVVDVPVVVVLVVDVPVVVVLVVETLVEVEVVVVVVVVRVVVVVVVVLVEVATRVSGRRIKASQYTWHSSLFALHSYSGIGSESRIDSSGKMPPTLVLYTIGVVAPPHEMLSASRQGTLQVPMASTERPRRIDGAQ